MPVLATLETADLLLAGIALPMLCALVAIALTSIGVALALGAASVPASGTIGYALFWSPPKASAGASAE